MWTGGSLLHMGLSSGGVVFAGTLFELLVGQYIVCCFCLFLWVFWIFKFFCVCIAVVGMILNDGGWVLVVAGLVFLGSQWCRCVWLLWLGRGSGWASHAGSPVLTSVAMYCGCHVADSCLHWVWRSQLFGTLSEECFEFVMWLLFSGVPSWHREHVESKHPPHSMYCPHCVVGRLSLFSASSVAMPAVHNSWPKLVHCHWRMDCFISLSDTS